MKKPSQKSVVIGLCAVVFLALIGVAVYAATNISSSGNAHWGWSPVVGWIDFYTPSTTIVSATGLTGYATSSIGTISFDCNTPPSGGPVCAAGGNYHVVNDGAGNLAGWAWSDAVGWISFCGNASGGSTWNGSKWICPSSPTYQATIDGTGIFHGWVWNNTIGWISLNSSEGGGSYVYNVQSSWVATNTIGMLDSVTYDTGVAGGAQFNSVEWQGVGAIGVPNGGVQLQLAVGNTPTGTWTKNFTGSDGTINTYWVPSGPGAVMPLTPLSPTLYTNYRYFRYRVTLIATPTSTPRVDNVIVGWSP